MLTKFARIGRFLFLYIVYEIEDDPQRLGHSVLLECLTYTKISKN